ncbi:hypothetical protein FEZ18_04465 [Oceanihabitans sp. IOP_32]|uniref:hypothetical protein n=1 Tax=Oceanihabitans sp. IOP_32 TaxID=2529032 RepID=UPI0012935027|nr:hypothetical protein [Oceanihabitans sp. IOP_32]QFZ54112.1 hypothetical protein FEZ18_04465 [Oceanihabitans sp. IOP_32]
MKKIVLKYIGIIVLFVLGNTMVFAQEGFGTNTPNKSAVIDLDSEKRGLLIPRVQLTSTIVEAPIISPVAQSLLVYNENTTTGANGVTPGYYYWDTKRWMRFAEQNDIQSIALAGDVTGLAGNTNVVAIQGTAIDATTPVANQVLVYNGTNWTPTSTNTISGSSITVTGGSGATLNNVNLEITPGTNGQVLVTDSGAATWANPSTLIPATTNTLTSAANTMSSTVNGVSSNATIINGVSNTLTGANLETSVNGVRSAAVDLSTAIQAEQNTTTLADGVNTTVTAATTGNNTAYQVNVSKTAIQNNQKTTEVSAGTGVTVNTAVSGDVTTYTVNAESTTANNGLTKTTNNIELGGALTQSTTITTTATNTLKVDGLQDGTTDDNLVALETDGTLRQVKAAMPKFFYMPPIVFDTSTKGTGLFKDLHSEYVNQFGGTALVSSAEASGSIPTLAANELEYYITYYDTDVFENLRIDANGVLTYDIKANATEASFMTIVFVVK